MTTEKPLSALPKTFLQFSGGKDSLACLYLLEKRWPEITVCWVNSGAAFPETVMQMQKIHAMVPHFLTITSEQSIERDGYPVDVLPVAATSLGQLTEAKEAHRFQSRFTCCLGTLWQPMANMMKQLGAEVVIRGQKLSDKRKGPVKHGDVVAGVRYEYPLAEWTDADVLAYLKEKGVELPANYRYMATGLDCWNCTAYLDENAGRLTYMREHHSARFEHVRGVLNNLVDVIEQQTRPLLSSMKEME